MEALRLMAVPSDGKLFVPVPAEYNNREVEVIILMNSDVPTDEKSKALKASRLSIVGKAPYPDFPISKYDVYNQ